MAPLPRARRVLMAATACSAVVLPVALSASAASADAPNPSACNGLHHGNPPGSLVVTTIPPSGAVLHPGDEVEVTATWATADWPGPVLHKVLNCLLVNGTIDYGRSTQEKPTANDGIYRYRFTVPAGAGGRICDRVRLSGRLVEDGDLVVQKSNTVCFSIAASGGGGAPGRPVEVTASAATPEPAPGEPATLSPAAAAPTPTDGPDVDPVPVPAETLGPALQVSSVSYRPTLPVTGGDVLPLIRLGTLLVLFGGAVLVARAALTGQDAPSPTVT